MSVLICIILITIVAFMSIGVHEVFYRCFRSENQRVLWFGMGACIGEIVYFGGRLIMDFESVVMHPEQHSLLLFTGIVLLFNTVLGMIRGILTKGED